MKNNRSIILVVLLIVISLMAVGYSAFATHLTLNGTAEITGEWNVKITGIEAKYVSDGCEAGDPQFTNTDATFDAKLLKPGDKITYEITIQNAGTIDASLENVTLTSDDENGSTAIKYTNTDPSKSLLAGEQTTFTVTVMYDENTAEVPSVKTKTITGTIEYVQK